MAKIHTHFLIVNIPFQELVYQMVKFYIHFQTKRAPIMVKKHTL